MREILRSKALDGMPHGFFTGIGHDGEPDTALIAAESALVTVRQVHSSIALPVTAPFAPATRPEADALVTDTPGLALGIVTADCAPVLFADAAAGVVGAAHAGWRGALGGVLENTVLAMEALGARRADMTAAIGPAIAQESYEVDAAFHARFVEDDSENQRFFRNGKPLHYQFDLIGYVAARLQTCGIAAAIDCAFDTYADASRFHSFRRATHRGEPTYGRQFSLIAPPV